MNQKLTCCYQDYSKKNTYFSGNFRSISFITDLLVNKKIVGVIGSWPNSGKVAASFYFVFVAMNLQSDNKVMNHLKGHCYRSMVIKS